MPFRASGTQSGVAGGIVRASLCACRGSARQEERNAAGSGGSCIVFLSLLRLRIFLFCWTDFFDVFFVAGHIFPFTCSFSRNIKTEKQFAAMSLLKKVAPMKPLLIPAAPIQVPLPFASRQPEDEAKKEPHDSHESQQKVEADANDDAPKTFTAAKKPAKAPLLFSSITTKLVESAGVAQSSSKKAPAKSSKRKEASAGESAPAAKKTKAASGSSAKVKAPASASAPEQAESSNDVRVKAGRSAWSFYSSTMFGKYANDTLGEVCATAFESSLSQFHPYP